MLNGVLKKAGGFRTSTIFDKNVQLLAYADDIGIGLSKIQVIAAYSFIQKDSAQVALP